MLHHRDGMASVGFLPAWSAVDTENDTTRRKMLAINFNKTMQEQT